MGQVAYLLWIVQINCVNVDSYWLLKLLCYACGNINKFLSYSVGFCFVLMWCLALCQTTWTNYRICAFVSIFSSIFNMSGINLFVGFFIKFSESNYSVQNVVGPLSQCTYIVGWPKSIVTFNGVTLTFKLHSLLGIIIQYLLWMTNASPYIPK